VSESIEGAQAERTSGRASETTASRQLADVAKLEWGNTSITKKSYIEQGHIAFSASGPDGFLNHFEWTGEAVILSAIGARCGKCFFARGNWTAIKNTIVIQGDSTKIDHKYLYYFLNDVRRWKISGSGQPFITLKTARETSIPVPALEEQVQIVAELEKQFSRLDEAVANLQRVKANLKRYKASVLKDAVEGRLVPTEAELARREGRDLETGEQLLQQILQLRRKEWNGRGKYKVPVAVNTAALPTLPIGWTWATIEQLTYLVTSGSRGWGDFYSENGVLFIRAQDIKTDALNMKGLARVDVPVDAEGSRSSVGANDILVTITGANVTKSALVPMLPEPAFVSQHVALLKLTSSDTAAFVFDWLVSPANGRKTLEKWAYGAGKPGLSLEQVRALPVALPPIAEQTRIVDEVERRLSLVRGVEAEVDANLKRAQALRQSTLSKMFSPFPRSVSTV
jgi:type I restriction enzyme S subunit